MQKALFPGYTVGPDAYDDIVNVCPAYGKKAAIIGGGPTGIAAAYFLARGGVETTIFDGSHPTTVRYFPQISRSRISST